MQSHPFESQLKCAQNQHIKTGLGGWDSWTNLSVGILNVVVHKDHEENGNRHAKVPDQTSDLECTDQRKKQNEIK